MEYDDSADRENAIQEAMEATRLAIQRCDDGHEWPKDSASGDTCECGAFSLVHEPDGRRKVVATP